MNGMDFERQNISETIFNKISEDIIKEKVKKGEKLLSESQLCRLYKVSRISVRSAIHKLQAQGFVYTMPGKGTYVLGDNLGATMMRNMSRTLDLSEKEYMDIVELRQTIEYKSLELIARRGTPEDFSAMERALSKMKASTNDYKKYSEADLEFHLALINGSHNGIFFDIMKSFQGTFSKYFNEMNKVNFDEFSDSLVVHQKVLDAVKKGDVKTAQKTLLGNIETNIRNNKNQLRKE